MSRKVEERFGFRVGGRVEATELAFRNGVFKRKDAPVYGTVTGFAQSVLGIIVRRDNRKLASHYHIDFWKPAADSDRGDA